jgi:hypothetical protein
MLAVAFLGQRTKQIKMSKLKVTDFRVGNYIQDYECEPYIFQVEEICKHVGYELWLKYRKGSIKAKEPEPIAINKQWVEKFGFINQKYEHYFLEVNGLSIEFDILNQGVYHSFLEGRAINIHYVHELQNFYHSITGNELVVS